MNAFMVCVSIPNTASYLCVDSNHKDWIGGKLCLLELIRNDLVKSIHEIKDINYNLGDKLKL